MADSKEVQALRNELEQLRRQKRLLLSGYKAGGGLLALILLGPRLVSASRSFCGRAKIGDPLPREELADLFERSSAGSSLLGSWGL